MGKVVYGWKSGTRLSSKADAQVVGEHLAALGRRRTLTAEVVVDDAKAKRSPLHPLFEWDDSKAAVAHRLEQARLLLRSVTVVRPAVDGEEREPVRAFVALTGRVADDVDEDDDLVVSTRVYRQLDDVLANPVWRAEMLAIVKAELLAARRKYKAFTELAGVWAAVDEAAS